MAEKEEGAEEDSMESVYDDEGREDLADNDEISPDEEAFMKGYDEATDDHEATEKDRLLDKAFEEEDE